MRYRDYSKMSFPSEGKPLVTIITAVLNGEKYLEETIQSVLQQTYENIEYIIIDGGSSDSTLSIINKHEGQIDYWISEPDDGVYGAWNKALATGRGDWFAFLGSDDILFSDAVSSYIKHLSSLPEDVEFLSSRVELVAKNKKTRVIGSAWNWKDFSRYMNVAHPGALHHKSLFKRLGNYDSSYKIAGDYELLLRARDSLRAEYLNRVTVRQRWGGLSYLNPRVFEETFKAKVSSGGRNGFTSLWENWWAILKFKIKPLVGRF